MGIPIGGNIVQPNSGCSDARTGVGRRHPRETDSHLRRIRPLEGPRSSLEDNLPSLFVVWQSKDGGLQPLPHGSHPTLISLGTVWLRMATQNTGLSSDLEKPPYDANPANLETICAKLLKGPARAGDLLEDDSVSLSKQPINRNIGYGVRLGFLTESEGGYEVTSDGETLAHVGYEEAEWLFEKAVKKDSLYRSLLSKTVEKKGIEKVREKDCVSRESVLDTLTDEYDFSLGKRSLKAAAATYLRTLDAAGFGNYVRSDGEHPTRLELDETIFGSFLLDEKSELTVQETETASREEQEDEVQETAQRVSDEEVSVALTAGHAQVNINVDMGTYKEEETAEQIAQFARELEAEFESEVPRE